MTKVTWDGTNLVIAPSGFKMPEADQVRLCKAEARTDRIKKDSTSKWWKSLDARVK